MEKSGWLFVEKNLNVLGLSEIKLRRKVRGLKFGIGWEIGEFKDGFEIDDKDGMLEYNKFLCSRNWKKLRKERERFWDDLKWCIGCCEDRVVVTVDKEMENVVGNFGVSGMNECGGKLN